MNYSLRSVPNNIISAFIILLCVIIYPLTALLWALYLIYNQKKEGTFWLAVFVGTLGYYYPPTGDLYRYAEDYYYLKSATYSGLRDFLSGRLDAILPIIQWSIGKIGFNESAVRFIYSFFGSWAAFYLSFDLIYKNNANRSVAFLLFLLVFLFVDIKNILYRFGFSSQLFALGVYNILFLDKRGIGWLLIILACFNHWSFIIITFIFFIFSLTKFRGSKSLAVLCFISSFIFSFDLLDPVIQLLPFDPYIIDHLIAYTEGEWAGSFLNDHSSRYRLSFYLYRVKYILWYIMYLLYFRRSRFSGWLCFLLVLVTAVSPFVTIHRRFESASFLFFLLYALPFTINLRSRKIKRMFFIIGLMFMTMNIWSIRRELSISKEYNIFKPIMLMESNPYSEQWLYQNNYPDGAPVVNY